MSKIATLVLLCMSAAASAAHAAPQSALNPNLPVEEVQPLALQESEIVREKLALRRELNLERLHAYALAGAFPQNHVQPGLLNVFIDEDGHICAVANLIHLDGESELVQKTAATDNYIVLANVDKGPLMDWMLNSGFTQEEIGLIQAPYSFIEEPQMVEPAPLPQVTQVEAETKRVQKILLAVHKRLSKNTKKSLSIVTQRLLNQPTLAFSDSAPQQRFAQAP